MFTAFFYLLRAHGLQVSIQEWLLLLEAMEMGLHRNSVDGFYRLCRAILLKSEADFDRFDQAFLAFFQDIPWQGELPEQVWEWLNHPIEDLHRTMAPEDRNGEEASVEELLRRMDERLRQQQFQHNGGSKWVGTQGGTPWGNSGWHPNGLRIGGQGRRHTAMAASHRMYRDFRKDNRLDTRQFQMAFRTLRQLSAQEESCERELDVDGTVRDTGDRGGLLTIRYQKPRKNTIKVLLLMDSGGSMEYYAGLCSRLFQAATKAHHFKELHTYYFHNCISRELYTDPRLRWEDAVDTEWLLNHFDSSYKVILVGDATMNPSELWEKEFHWGEGTYSPSGYDWLQRFKRHYPYLIWLNPMAVPRQPGGLAQTRWEIARLVDMYQLMQEGLEQGMKRLMRRQ